VNFPLLEHHLALRGDCAVLKPDGDDSLPIHPRLISRRGPEGAREAFLRAFSLSEQRAMDAPVEEARQHIEAEQLEAAMAAYRRAVEARPRDWLLLGEVAEFLTRRLSDYKGGLELARLALEINPWCSAWLWNLLGDALYALDRFDEAHECYLSAERIHPADVRTNLNLAYSYLQMGRHRQALEAAAVGLAYDGQGIFRERLLAKQQHILSFVGNRWTSEQEWLARRAQRLR
jgi:tetratricopeptide (TPR) repeat protein